MRIFAKQKKLHDSCKTATVGIFMECLVNGNLQALVIEGQPTEDEQKQAWTNIYTEYSELTGDTKQTQEYLFVLKQYGEQHTRYMALMGAIRVLSNGYNEDAEKAIKILGYESDMKSLMMDEYLKELERNMKRLRGVSMGLKVAEKTLKDYLEQKNKIKWTPGKFLEFMACVSKYIGFPVNYDTNLLQFASYVNLMQKSNG